MLPLPSDLPPRTPEDAGEGIARRQAEEGDGAGNDSST